MSTRILTGTYTAGYTLMEQYSTLSITSTGRVEGADGSTGDVGGAGVIVNFDATLSNQGIVVGGGGGAYASGGAGIDMTAFGSVINSGDVFGGLGGDGTPGAHAGGGGVGIVFGAGGTLTNYGAIVGGLGGAGKHGGAGGAGVVFAYPGGGVVVYASVFNRMGGVIVGGAGGAPVPTSNGKDGSGGTGGAGVVLTGYGYDFGGSNFVSNQGVILGGAGGGSGHSAGAQGDGVLVNPVGYRAGVYNQGLIEGQIGVYVAPTTGYAAAVRVANDDGTIVGTGGVAVKLTSARDSLSAGAGSHFVGVAEGGGGYLVTYGTGAISLQGGSGTLSGGVDLSFSEFGRYAFSKGSMWSMSGANTLLAGQTILAYGSLTMSGTLTSAATSFIKVGGYGHVILSEADIVGGRLLSSSESDVVVLGDGNILDGTTTPVELDVSVVIGDAAVLKIQGQIENFGKPTYFSGIDLTAGSHHAGLFVGAAGATLSGGGTVALSDNDLNIIRGVDAAATLTNVDNTISGAGRLGAGEMVLVNETKGVIDATGTVALNINTGASTILNAGTIEAVGPGRAIVVGALDNTGRLVATGGALTVEGPVTGTGTGTIDGGTLDFESGFSQNVTFAGATGELVLGQSQTFAHGIFGFSHTGGTSLDLRDIKFVSASEATFSDGVLTVSDGVHTARIKLIGDYVHANFIASSDGHGGTDIVTGKSNDVMGPLHAFAFAMAGFGSPGGEVFQSQRPEPIRDLTLAPPRIALA